MKIESHIVSKNGIHDNIFWPLSCAFLLINEFKDFYGLLFVHDAIDVIQIHIQKPWSPFAKNFYSFKLKV